MNEAHRDTPGAEPPDLLVLAAVARAQRHRSAPGTGVTRREIHAHLAIEPRSSRARTARDALRRLAAEGALRTARRHGVAVWGLTPRGRTALARARAGAGGTAGRLPEAPQHRSWRLARERAADAVPGLRLALRRDLRDAARLLAAGEQAASDAWLELAERLGRDAWRLGSAIHCLREWPEPSDERADIDRGIDAGDGSLAPRERERRRLRRAGRRNPSLWES